MTLIEPNADPRAGGKDSALRDWLRALEATAPIAANPQRILPRVIEELAADARRRAALLSAHETLTYRALAARQPLCALGARRKISRKGETSA